VRLMDDLRNLLQRAGEQTPPPNDPYERLLRRRDRRRRNKRLTSGALALCLAAVGTAVAVMAIGGPGPAEPEVIPGAQETGPILVADEGEYYYTRTLLYYEDLPCDGCQGRLLGPWTFEIWFGPNASGRAVFVDNPLPDGSVDYSWRGDPDRTYGPGEMPFEDLSALPTDPAELHAHLTERSAPGGASPNPIATTSPGRSQEDTSLLRTFQDLFDGDEQFTPPLVRAAMFEVAAGITGVETIEGTTDPVDRPAISLRWVIQYEGPPSVVEWFFDPETKQLMAETWTQEGQILQARVVTEAGIAGSDDGPPPAGDLFFPAADGPPWFVR
jgi:hypothetical protein